MRGVHIRTVPRATPPISSASFYSGKVPYAQGSQCYILEALWHPARIGMKQPSGGRYRVNELQERIIPIDNAVVQVLTHESHFRAAQGNRLCMPSHRLRLVPLPTTLDAGFEYPTLRWRVPSAYSLSSCHFEASSA